MFSLIAFIKFKCANVVFRTIINDPLDTILQWINWSRMF